MSNIITTESYREDIPMIYKSLSIKYLKSCKNYQKEYDAETVSKHDARPVYFGNTAHTIQSFYINWLAFVYLCQNNDKRREILGEIKEEEWKEMVANHVMALFSDLYISCFSYFEDFVRRIAVYLSLKQSENFSTLLPIIIDKLNIAKPDKENYKEVLKMLGFLRNAMVHNSGRFIGDKGQDAPFSKLNINGKEYSLEMKKDEQITFFSDKKFLPDVLHELHTLSVHITEIQEIKKSPFVKSALDGYSFDSLA